MLSIDSVELTYRNGTQALAGVDLMVDAGRITAVIGGSGCGKSTLLRLIAGLERSTAGVVEVAGHPVDGPSDDVGVVFQEPRLMPWLTVAENVSFGLDHLGRQEAAAVTAAALERVGLGRFAEALPKELSGGMAQRVALARALVTSPAVLLLDEPFSALDAFTRADLQQHLIELWEADHQTTVIVTHDIDEALLLADNVVVMAGQPGSVVAEFEIDVTRPRRLANPELVELRASVLDWLSNKPREPDPAQPS